MRLPSRLLGCPPLTTRNARRQIRNLDQRALRQPSITTRKGLWEISLCGPIAEPFGLEYTPPLGDGPSGRSRSRSGGSHPTATSGYARNCLVSCRPENPTLERVASAASSRAALARRSSDASTGSSLRCGRVSPRTRHSCEPGDFPGSMPRPTHSLWSGSVARRADTQ